MVFSRTMLVIHGIALLCQTAMSTQRLAFTRDEDELVISAAINSSHAELGYAIGIDIEHGHTLVIDTVLTAEATDLSPHPVVFIVKQEEVIDHWHLPSRNGVKSNFSSRTLCPPADGRQSMDILLTVSTMSKMWIPFTVVLRRARYLISPEQPSIPITVSPASPWVFRLELSENLRYLVKLRNMSTSVCSVVTVRPDNNACPLPHMENEMVFGSRAKHQVMLEKAAIHVTRDLFPAGTNAINIFIIAKMDDSGCYPNTMEVAHGEERKVDLQLSVEVVTDDVLMSVFSVLGIYVGGGILIVLLHCSLSHRDR